VSRALTLHCMNFQKHDKKKFHLIKYIQKHNRYYTKITLLTIFRILMKICVCITYDTSWLLSTFTLYGYVSHMIQHVYWQPLIGAHWSVSYLLHPSSTGRTISLRNIWKYVYCLIYGTKCSEGLKHLSLSLSLSLTHTHTQTHTQNLFHIFLTANSQTYHNNHLTSNNRWIFLRNNAWLQHFIIQGAEGTTVRLVRHSSCLHLPTSRPRVVPPSSRSSNSN
jgi:hypothetical protein